MAEKIIKLNLDVDSKKGEASIKKTSAQLKVLGTTAAAGGAAIGAGSKAAAGGMLLMGATTVKTATSISKLAKESSKTAIMVTKITTAQAAGLPIMGEYLDKAIRLEKRELAYREAMGKGAAVSENRLKNLKKLGNEYVKYSKDINKNTQLQDKNTKAGITTAATTTKLGEKTHKLVKEQTSSASAAYKTASALVKTDVEMIKILKSMPRITDVMRSMGKAMKSNKTDMAGYMATLNHLNNLVKENKIELEKRKKSLKDSVSVMRKARKEYEKCSKNINKNTQLQDKNTKAQKKNTTAINESARASGLLKKASIALGAAITASIIIGAKFERKMATVGGVMRAIPSDLKLLSNAARKMGMDSEWGANKAADALKFMGMAGYSAQQAIKALPGVLNLATSAGLDLASVSDIVTDSLTAMNMSVDELSRFSDVLTGVTTRSNTSILMMGESLKYVAPVASQMGYDIEQLSAMLGILANAGIKASDAGTDLRQAMIKNVKVAKKFGKEENDLIGTLEAASEAGWGVTEVTENYGLIAAKSVLVLMKQIKGFRELEEELRGVKGETDRLAKVKLDTLTGDFNKLKSAAKELGLVIYDHIEGVLRTVVQEAGLVTTALAKLFDTRPEKPAGRADIYEDLGFNIKQKRAILALEDKKAIAIRNLESAEKNNYQSSIERNKQRIKDYDAEIAKAVKLYILENKAAAEKARKEKVKVAAEKEKQEDAPKFDFVAAEKEKQANLLRLRYEGFELNKRLLKQEEAFTLKKYEHDAGAQVAILASFNARKLLLVKAYREDQLSVIINASEKEAQLLRDKQKLEEDTLESFRTARMTESQLAIDSLNMQFLKYDTFVKDKSALDAWYVKQYAVIEETKNAKKAADHEKVLQYISTEEENALRAINTERDAMLERTTTLEEYIAVMERSAELKTELASKTEIQTSGIQKWASTAMTLTEQWEATAVHAAESFSSGMVDAFFEFAEGTKSAEDAFRDFAANFLKEIAKMIMQQLVLNALKSAAGSYFGDGGVVEGGEQTALAKGGVLSQGKMMEYAKGAAFNNGMQMHAFAAGGIVNSPTIFPMKNGMGLLGEAGPEAIMPLKRGKDGKLGVEGGGGNTVNTTINITTGGQGEDPEESKRRGREIARTMEAEFNRNLTKQMRPGGLLNQQ